MILSKGGIPLQIFRQVAGNILTLKTFSIKLTTILVGKPLYFPATCLKYNNFIGVFHYNLI